MGTKNISFTNDLEAYIDAKVASGEYAHASEVVRDGVRMLMREEAEKLEWLRAAIAVGQADIAAGRVIPAEQMDEELEKRRKARIARSKSS